MDEELKCPACKQFYNNPVLLPCYHALCLSCAIDNQTSVCLTLQQLQVQLPIANGSLVSSTSNNNNNNNNNNCNSSVCSSSSSSTSSNSGRIGCSNHSSSSSSTTSSSSSGTDSITSDQDQADKVSILSETDSGVICCTSRPGSYTGTLNLQSLLLPTANNDGIVVHNKHTNGVMPQGAVLSLTCPVCGQLIFFDDGGVRNLPPYRTMESIIDRFFAREALKCQMCETDPKVASSVCEQCEIRYCDPCRDLCHPLRGPLAKHNFVKPKGFTQIKESLCNDHSESLSMYCIDCKLPACEQCINNNLHQAHNVQPIVQMCKAQKTELSHNLQQLSEKARSTTEFIQRLKGMSDKVTDSCIDFERLVSVQCETLIKAIQDKQKYLIEAIRVDKDAKLRTLKDQQLNCTSKLQQTTGLIQFCIETLKETDNAAFLQVGAMLINKVVNTDMKWHQEVTTAAPRVSPIIELTLDDAAVLRAIENLNFIHSTPNSQGDEKIHVAPMVSIIRTEDCAAENNSVTVAWQAPNHSLVEGYVLELDDGNGGEFREVYCGKETICTVDGLHFNSLYKARVKAFNNNGEGEYSELVGLQTAEVAWFAFDPRGDPGLIFSKNNLTVSVDGWEHRVALGSVGFSRGIHYWEFTVDNYTADTDPAFGVARIDVNRNKMLGKDDKSFAMYIDNHRSWFQHNSIHERRVEGGITTGSTIGVLLDLERHILSFLVNEMPQGSVAFRNLYGVFYPAVSINRGVKLTLHTGLPAPRMDYH